MSHQEHDVQAQSLAEVFYKVATEHKNKGITYILGEKEEVFCSYSNLYSKAQQLLYVLQSRGIKPGDEVILQLPDTDKYLEAFWACILGGMIPVLLPVAQSEQSCLRVIGVCKMLNHPVIIAYKQVFQGLQDYAMRHSDNLAESMGQHVIILDQIEELKGMGIIHNSDLNDPVFIQFSSGSTGDPKGVVLTNQNILSSIGAIIYGMKVGQAESSLTWMPLTHDMAMIAAHLGPLAYGVNQYVMHPSLFLRQPVLWLSKVSEHKASMTMSPNFGYQHFLSNFNPQQAQGWDLSHVRIIINGAEPVRIDLCNQFLNQMAEFGLRKEVMETAYGMSEAGLAITYPDPVKEFSYIRSK